MDSFSKYTVVGKGNYIFIAPTDKSDIFPGKDRITLVGARVIAYPDNSNMQLRRLPNFGLNMEAYLIIPDPDWVTFTDDEPLYVMHPPPKRPVGIKNA